MTQAEATADLRDTALGEPDLSNRLGATWGTGRGLLAWLSSVDHKVIGRRYIATAFIFLFRGAATGGCQVLQTCPLRCGLW